MDRDLYLEREGRVGILYINRPDVLNALSKNVLEKLLALFKKDLWSSEGLLALIITGVGDRAFIAGADIAEMEKMDRRQIVAYCSLGQKVMAAMRDASFVTIAAVNGYALGGGLEVALACDFIYAKQAVLLGFPEVKLGLIPGFGGLHRLTQAIGERRAKELILTGKMISAEEALPLGLINGIYQEQQLLPHCKEVAELIAGYSQRAVHSIKKAIHASSSYHTKTFELEHKLFVYCFTTQECREQMHAFLGTCDSCAPLKKL